MTARTAFRTIGYRRFSADAAIRRIAAIGYDGVEICLEHPGLEPEEINVLRGAALATVAAGESIEVATVSYHGDRDPLRLRWKRALRAIELTSSMGTGILIINSPRPGPEAPSDLQAQFEEHLEEQLERAERLGVILAIEPEPGLLVDNVDDALELIDRMQSDHLRVNLDVGHAFLTEDDVPAAIRRLGDLIVAAHIEDMPRGEHRHLIPGEGDMDLPAIVEALDDIGFDGWLTVDLFDIADAPDQAAEASLARVRELVSE
ncbi:MAG: sugar phosphate isomerase/epimerase family protein [Armatimonadota bacterium]